MEHAIARYLLTQGWSVVKVGLQRITQRGGIDLAGEWTFELDFTGGKLGDIPKKKT